MDDIEEYKYNLIRALLHDVDVAYFRHENDEGVKNMARVNGNSIIWHKWSYGSDDPTVVEVMFKNPEDVDSNPQRVKLTELREKLGLNKE